MNNIWYPNSKRYKAYHPPPTKKKCRDCACIIPKAKTLCPSCMEISRANNATNMQHKRRILLQTAGYEKINKILVFERADWTCQMCGISTPKRLIGQHLNNAPTLDHIVPISKGGSHTYNNVQLLCRKCNCTLKRDK